MNDKLMQYSDISLSEKDLVEEKDNSIQNKSFYSTDFNFPDLVEKKEYFQIKIIPNENSMELKTKSIQKIFQLFCGKDIETLEENYLDYITCLIGMEDDIEKQQLLNLEGKVDNPQTNLDPSYYELLNKTKIYYINIPKLNKLNQINKRIKLKSKSLEKISSFLGLNIFDMSDYIEIFILSFTDKENIENKKSIKSKLIEKFNLDLNNDINFNIVKNFPLIIKEVEKCEQNKLQYLEDYFDKVWNEIENKNNNEDDNISNSKDSEEKNEEKDNNIKEENYDIPNSYNIINQNINIKNKEENKIGELRDDSACSENMCAKICNIF